MNNYIDNYSYETHARHVQLNEVRSSLMQDLGGIKCINCEYDQLQALTIAYKNGRHGRKVLNLTQYINYLKNFENAKNDLEVLCSNCLQTRVRTTRSHEQGSEYSLYGKKSDLKQRRKIMEILNQHSCIKCDHNNFLALQIGHTKEGVSQSFKKLFKSKRRELNYYIKNPDIAKQDLQILCANCVKTLKACLATENTVQIC